MENYSEINKYILNKTIDGSIDREHATKILKAISKETGQEEFAIIGMECKVAHTDSKEEFWDCIINGTSGVREMPRQRIDQIKSLLTVDDSGKSANVGYLERIDYFDPAFFRISNKEARFMDPKQRMFLEVFYNAMEDAGYAPERLNGKKVGIFIGADHSSDMQVSYKMMLQEPDMMGEVGTVSGILARRPAYIYNLSGPAMILDTSCSSSMVAIHTACQAMSKGDCEMAVIGGINLIFFTNSEGKFSDIESKSALIRSFDKNASGTNWGEGIASIIIKPLDKAIKDRDNILAVLKGSSINNDGFSNGIVSPNPEAQEAVISSLLKECAIDPNTISYVECHGTGTVVGDQIEIRGLTNAYRKYTNKKQYCGIGSVKPNIGHLIGASALVGIIKLVMAMNKRIMPPSINFEEPNKFIKFIDSPFYLVDKDAKWGEGKEVLRAALNSFGFSGTNTHAIFESAPEKEKTSEADPYELVTLSSFHKDMMEDLLTRYITFLTDKKDSLNLADVCYTMNIGRRSCQHRVAFLVKNIEQLIEQMKEKQNELSEGKAVFQEEDVDYQTGIKQMNELIHEYKVSERKNLSVLEKMKVLYESGIDVKWEQFYGDCERYRISLPVTKFKKIPFWIEKSDSYDSPYGKKTEERCNITEGIYKPVWNVEERKETEDKVERYIIFTDHGKLENAITKKLLEEGKKVFSIGRTKRNSCFKIETTSQESYNNALKEAKAEGFHDAKILYFLRAQKESDIEQPYKNIVRLFKAISDAKMNTVVKVVTDRAFKVMQFDSNPAGIAQNMMLGACKTVGKEMSFVHCECIDVDESALLHDKDALQSFYEEIKHKCGKEIVALRKGIRFVQGYKNLPAGNAKKYRNFKKEGVYFITGGTGSLGVEVAEYLTQNYDAKVALLTRRQYGDLEIWLKEHTDKEKNYSAMKKLYELQQKNAKVIMVHGDVANYAQLEKAVCEAEEQFGNIDGVFHLAGLTGGRLMVGEQLDQEIDVFAGKARGLDALDQVFADRLLNQMILFSSMLSFFAPIGQSTYVAANMYLAGYANMSREKYPDRNVICIDWDNFEKLGMASEIDKDATKQEVFEYAFGNGLNAQDCMTVLEASISFGESELYATLKNLDKLIAYLNENGSLEKIEMGKKQKKKMAKRPELSVPYVEPHSNLQEYMANVWAELFEVEKIGILDDFNELGGDSIFAIKFVTAMKDQCTIEVADVFAYPTIEKLSLYLAMSKVEVKEKFDHAKEWLATYSSDEGLCKEEIARREQYYEKIKVYEDIDLTEEKEFKNILLLGSTGFLGIYLLHDLLVKTNNNIYLIVRGGKEGCYKRLQDIVIDFHGEDFYNQYKDRMIVFDGDVSKDGLGVDVNTYQMLAEEIDCIVNSVGKVDHYGKYNDFYVANVVSVKNIIELAKTGIPKEIHHVSTKGVAMGNVPERQEVIFTEYDIDFHQEILNDYCATKDLAERLLEKAQAEGIIVNIYRTAEIMGDSRTGKFQRNIDKNAVYIEIKALMNFDCLVSPSIEVWQMAFVDTISDFISALILKKSLVNETLHLFSSFGTAVDDWIPAFKQIGLDKERVSIDDFLDYLYENQENPEKKKYVREFLLHTNILEGYEATKYKILTDKTDIILQKMNLEWHKPTTEQLVQLLEYGKSVGFFEY